MVRIDKHYFTLRETAARWELAIEDLAYLAETGELRVSTRLEGAHLERGTIQTQNGFEYRIPAERKWFSGILDLRRRDAYRIFRDGQARLVQFGTDDHAYATVVDPTPPLEVGRDHLVVRRDERDRIEALHGAAGRTVAEGVGFEHSADYRSIRCGDLRFSLGRVQANVIRLLHEASRTDDVWRYGKAVLAEAGSTSNRMSDVFKSQPRWRELIESDRYRKYRLRIRLR